MAAQSPQKTFQAPAQDLEAAKKILQRMDKGKDKANSDDEYYSESEFEDDEDHGSNKNPFIDDEAEEGSDEE